MIEGGMVIDFHGHPGRWGLAESSPENLLHSMDAIGVDYSILFSVWHPEGTRGNDHTASVVATHPDRFLGFAYVSPLMPDAMVPELTRAFDELHLKGIKLYPPFTGINLNEPPWFPIYQFADDRGLAVIWHTGIEAPAQPKYVADVAPRFPNAIFVCGHSGNCPPMRAMAIDAARNNPNVYLETCSTFRTPGAIEELRPLRIGRSAHGPPAPGRQDHHRRHQRRGQASRAWRKRPPHSEPALGPALRAGPLP